MKIIEQKITGIFPDYTLILHLASLCDMKEPFRPLFYDIETTGLSKKTTQLYLIGTVFYQDNDWILKQWFAEQPEEEILVLKEFLSFSSSFTHTIQFNGNHFDAPYLRERYTIYDLCSPLDTLPALDLYQFIKPLKQLFQLNHLRQSDLEQLMSLSDRVYPDGKKCIKHYRNYVGNPNETDFEMCIGHNREDLIGMGSVYLMLSYQGLLQNEWDLIKTSSDSDEIIFQIRLKNPVPISIAGGIPGIYMRIEQDSMRILVHINNGKLQQFYLNFKEYDFLIQENTAIPKSLGIYIDKSLKISATLENCYTWFNCNESFLSDSSKQTQYLRHLIPYLVKVLSK